MSKDKKHRNRFLDALFPKTPQKSDLKFKDSKERFKRFDKLYKDPNIFSFFFISIVSLILTIIPICISSSIYNVTTISFLIIGFVLSLFSEQIANIHYKYYLKKANKKSYESVKWNILFNKTLRLLATIGWVFSVFALSMMLFTDNGSLAELW